MIRFLAESGNWAEVKILAVGDRGVIDMNWERAPSERDISESKAWIQETLNPAELDTIVEENRIKRAAIIPASRGRGRMTNESAAQNHFEGWAILEIFGHQKYAGYVTTQVFGAACMFRLDVPPLEERERVTKRTGYVGDQYVMAGATVKEGATQGYTKLFGVGAIYAITPCTEATAKLAVEELQPRPLILVSLPADKALEAPAEPDYSDDGETEDEREDSRDAEGVL